MHGRVQMYHVINHPDLFVIFGIIKSDEVIFYGKMIANFDSKFHSV
jgi:hypothetical protein